MDKPERRSGPQSSPDPETDCGFDEDFDEWTAWLDREVAAGRDPVPPERFAEAEGISVSVGDADGIDPELLAAICGLDSDGLGPQFGQHAAADVLPPGPVLAALTEAAVADVTRLSDSQLIGVLQAARRQENREAWKKALVIAEFARRRAAEFEAAAVAGAPVHCRPGQFPGEELAVELLLGPAAASHAIDDAGDLATRLPRTLAGMAAGLIDEARAGAIAMYTRSLSADDVALADDILAALAPTLRLDRLIGKAAALEKKLNPEGVRARQEHARRTRQRVEVRREDSGNASVAGREMDPGEALASKAYLHALALRLRRAGLPGTLDQLRLAVFGDLTSGRDPMDRLARPAVGPAAAAPAGPESAGPDPAGPDPAAADPAGPESATASVPKPDAATSGPAEGGVASAGPVSAGLVAGDAGTTLGSEDPAGQSGFVDYDHDEDGGGDCPDDPAPGPRPPVPMPAMINLVVHAGTLFGWDTTPTEVGGWGLLDADETRALVAAASQHPATRWCLTLLGLDGTAGAHGCSPGQHHWTPEEPQDKPPGRRPPDPAQVTALAAFLRGLNVTPEPIAKGDCDHAAAGSRYTPSRKLAHLVRARTVTCDAPGCSAQAVHSDLDHTTPYPQGPTCQCNLAPKCRRHHKAKQAPDWKVEQPEPDLICWTLPSGRTYTTRPTSYLL
jgi:hypothetical protein